MNFILTSEIIILISCCSVIEIVIVDVVFDDQYICTKTSFRPVISRRGARLRWPSANSWDIDENQCWNVEKRDQ